MDYPADLKYTKDHEWVKVVGEVAVVGITDYAQDALGDIVFVEMPKAGVQAQKGKGIAVVESVKSVSDVFAPVSGEVVEVNSELEAAPEKVNKDPYGSWMFKIKMKDQTELSAMMSADDYKKLAGKD
ncbi:MAG: glycine cleavage system protein GcvH [Candidatus Altiarchaeota archaeon]|nr:glycine cleavage system protein GcvH [Candidatus Altiarchaeota archaeon]